MKKYLKITGIVIGIIIIVVLIVVVLFPAFPTYIKVKKNCPHINDVMGVYTDDDISVPKDFVQAEIKGLLISAPDGTRNIKSDMIPFKDGKDFMVMVSQSELSDYNFYNDEITEYSKQEYWHFYEKFGGIPKSSVDDIKFLRNMNLKDCLKLRGTDIKIFEELAEAKESVSVVESVSIYERENISGILCDVDSVGKTKEYMNLMFNYGGYEYIVTVIGEDSETVKQVISSVTPIS
ncbi:MAG: hypothetical protein K2J40_04610 [Ruminococcus sp.]|nr:hypothetical protein [Ruminococcus sp.]